MDIVNNPQYFQNQQQGLSKGKREQQNALYTLESGKIPPQNIEIEQAVLGALMLERNALTAVIDILKKDIFYKIAHQHIFEAISQLFQKS